MRRRLLGLSAVALAFFVAAGTVSALPTKVIKGTAHNDVLPGTAKNDTIYGLAGNDRLIGLEGNDTLIGGPGADNYSCGAGKDTVIGDAKDKRPGSGCEKIIGIPAPHPPPPPPPPPPSGAMAGRYCGFTNQGVSVCVDVTPDGHGITNLVAEVVANCQPTAQFKLRVSSQGVIPLDSSLSFTDDYRSTDLDQFATGTFDTDGNVHGQLHVRANFDSQGTHYACDSGPLTDYTAKLGA